VTADELVLVVPRRAVIGPQGWHGVRTTSLAAALEAIGRLGEYLPRGRMEVDPRWKQVIPYVVLRDRADYFLMRRTRAGRDERLHDRFSVGVGGHLNPGDGGLEHGLVREWQEELLTDFVPRFEALGLLNDDTTDVGRVHLGVVYVADAAGRNVAIRETDKLSGSFARPHEVAAVADRLETWSRIVFEFLEDAVTSGGILRSEVP